MALWRKDADVDLDLDSDFGFAIVADCVVNNSFTKYIYGVSTEQSANSLAAPPVNCLGKYALKTWQARQVRFNNNAHYNGREMAQKMPTICFGQP